jgi:type III pantothenate kinase
MKSTPNLVVDWGNTRIKVATFLDNESLDQFTFTTKEEAKEYLRKQSFHHALVSTVGGDAKELSEVLVVDGNVILLTSETPLPIKVLYATPKTLGVDRLAAACGASQLFPNQASLVIDLGSCINYEFTDAQANYHGGAISPGVAMRFEAMHRLTTKLPLVKPIGSSLLIGSSSEACMQSGVMNGVLFELNGFIETIKRDYAKCNILLCGGDAHFFEGKVNGVNFVPELVLLGLNKILQHNLNVV